METTEKIVLSPETYENVSRMLGSPDNENVLVALSALEGMDFKSCKMYMALLYKESQSKAAMWEEHAPTLLKNIKSLGLDEGITLTSIFKVLNKDASEGELQVFSDRFGGTLKTMLKAWGFGEIIDDLNIKISVNNDRQK